MSCLCRPGVEWVKVDSGGKGSERKMKMHWGIERVAIGASRPTVGRSVWRGGGGVAPHCGQAQRESEVIYPLVWIIHHLSRCERSIHELQCWTQMLNIWGQVLTSNFPGGHCKTKVGRGCIFFTNSTLQESSQWTPSVVSFWWFSITHFVVSVVLIVTDF